MKSMTDYPTVTQNLVPMMLWNVQSPVGEVRDRQRRQGSRVTDRRLLFSEQGSLF